jgi:hypothetical protein
VFQVEGSSVEEYLQQVHEMTVVTAIQARPRPALLGSTGRFFVSAFSCGSGGNVEGVS